jgi:hypothetical protein
MVALGIQGNVVLINEVAQIELDFADGQVECGVQLFRDVHGFRFFMGLEEGLDGVAVPRLFFRLGHFAGASIHGPSPLSELLDFLPSELIGCEFLYTEPS